MSERRSYTPEERLAIAEYAIANTPQAAADKYGCPLGTAKNLRHRYEERQRKLQAMTVDGDEQPDVEVLAKLAPDAMPLAKWLRLRSVSERRWLAEGERGSAFAAKAAAACLKIADDRIAELRAADASRLESMSDVRARAEAALAALGEREESESQVMRRHNEELLAEVSGLRDEVAVLRAELGSARMAREVRELPAPAPSEPMFATVRDSRASARPDDEPLDVEIIEESAPLAHNATFDITGADLRDNNGRTFRVMPGSTQCRIGGGR
jgi:hypothetical protein